MTTKITQDNLTDELILKLITGPRASNVQYVTDGTFATVLDDVAATSDTNTFAIINGVGFTNVSVRIGTQAISNVTVVSDTQIRMEVPVLSSGSYNIILIDNDNGGTGILLNGYTVSPFPAWSTSATLATQDTGTDFAVNLSATSDSNVVYTLAAGSSLPGNVTLSSNGVLSGNVFINDDTTYSFSVVATDQENQDASRTFSVTISVGDPNFKSTTLLLGSDQETFITDSSDNIFTITPAADVRPTGFNPFGTSWSAYFDGSGDFLSIPSSTAVNLSSGDFTIEFWVWWTGLNSSSDFVNKDGVANSSYPCYGIGINGSNRAVFTIGSGNGTSSIQQITSNTDLPRNQWVHIAAVKSGNTLSLFQNGTRVVTATQTATITDGGKALLIGYQTGQPAAQYHSGYLSDVRIVKGTAVYNAAATTIAIPTAPLTAISGTSLLTCQSNRFIDVANNATITRNGETKISNLSPFSGANTTSGSGYFDGNGDYLTVPPSQAFAPGTGDFTLDVWVYPTNIATESFIWTQTVSGTNYFVWGFNSTTAFFIATLSGGGTSITGPSGQIKTNAWNHIAVVRQSGTVTVYVNGIGGTGVTNTTNLTNTTYVPTIGTYTHSTSYALFTGYMSSLRYIKGLAVYTGAFTPPNGPSATTQSAGTNIAAITNSRLVSLLTLRNRISYNNSQPIDESGINHIITRVGNSSAGTFSPHAPSGWSGYFDGTGDYLSLANDGNFDLYALDFTFETWAYLTRYSNAYTGGNYAASLINKDDNNQRSYNVQINGTASAWTSLAVGFFTTNSNLSTTTVNYTFSLNTWYHIAVVRNSGVVRVYVNGVDVGGGTNSVTIQTTSAGLTIGGQSAYWAGQGYAYNFPGYLSNWRLVKGVAVYTSAFTPPTAPLEPIAGTSLLTLRGPSLTDDGPKRFAITRNGDTQITPFSPYKPHAITPVSYGAYFDGTGDYLTTPSTSALSMGTGSFCLETWIYPTAPSGSQVIYANFSAGDTQMGVFIRNGNSIRFSSFDTAFLDSAAGTIVANNWYHIVISRVSTTLSMFINGTRVATATNSNNFSSTDAFSIARRPDNTQFFLGHISNLRVTKGSSPYDPTSTTITVPTSPLTAISGTSLLTCQSPTIIDNSSNALTITANGNSQPTKFNPFSETVTSGVQYSPTSHGGSVYFDGTDYLAATTQPLAGDFEISFWYYSLAAGQYLLGTGNSSGSWAFRLEGSFRINNLASDYITATGYTPYCWNHVCVSRSNGTIRLFYNGVFQGSQTNTSTFSQTALGIGSYGQTTSFASTAYISNLRIINGPPTYTSGFVPPQAPLTAIPGTTLLTCDNNAAIQDKTGRNVLETVGNARTLSFSPYRLNQSLFFDGSGDYLTSSVNAAITDGPFSIEMQIYPLSFSGSPMIFSNTMWRIGRNGGYTVTINTSGMIVLSASLGTFNTIPGVMTATTALQLNTWSHILITRNNAGQINMYINGTVAGTPVTYTNSLDLSYQNGYSGTFVTTRIGAHLSDNAVYQSFNGYMRDIRVVNGSIPAAYENTITVPTAPLTAVTNTVLLVGHTGTFRDGSVNNATFTRAGEVKITGFGPFIETYTTNNAMYFDGTGDYLKTVSTPLASLQGDFTIECWLYWTAHGNYGGIVSCANSNIGASPTSGWAFVFYSTTDKLYFETGSGFSLQTTNTIPSSQWNHVAVVRSGSTITHYLNGVANGSGTSSSAFDVLTTDNFVIGVDRGLANTLTGYIDDLRITKGVARYTANFTPPTRPHKVK